LILVAQRFTAAVTALFLNKALAAEGTVLAQHRLFPRPARTITKRLGLTTLNRCSIHPDRIIQFAHLTSICHPERSEGPAF